MVTWFWYDICLSYQQILISIPLIFSSVLEKKSSCLFSKNVVSILGLCTHTLICRIITDAIILSSSRTLLVLSIWVIAVMISIVTMISRAHWMSWVTWLPSLLLTIMELIADTKIILAGIYHLLKSVVVTMYFNCVCNDRFYSIVMAHYFHRTNDSKKRHFLVPGSFWEYLIIVTRNYQLWNCVPRTDFNRAIMTSKNHTITWFHYCHRDTMVWNINRILIGRAMCRSATNPLTNEVISSHVFLIHTSIIVLLLEIHSSPWHASLIKSLPKMLLEIYVKLKELVNCWQWVNYMSIVLFLILCSNI